ncbi:MAG: 16S rRNA (adenine(1518)-N(6)/adenine(1519)-N(6))-dimethyltransferase RsmA [Bdellovibrionales bacterium]
MTSNDNTRSAPSSLDALPPLREIIAQHGLDAHKALGQHFLLDLNLTRKIAAAAGDLAGHAVFEIGPGPGGLTRALLGTSASKVVTIEKDRRCVEVLQSLKDAAQGRLEIIEADALEADLTALAPAPRAIVANLPYNVGTPMLLNWLRRLAQDPPDATPPAFSSLTLMFQAEVAERLTAAPRSKAYGRLSVIAQHVCKIERVMTLPARAFTPPPKIDSAVVRLTPRRDRPAHVAFESLEKITAAAFGQRRKMLRSSLKPLGGEDLLRSARIAPNLRAEDLSVEEFEKLASLHPQPHPPES